MSRSRSDVHPKARIPILVILGLAMCIETKPKTPLTIAERMEAEQAEWAKSQKKIALTVADILRNGYEVVLAEKDSKL